MRIAAYVLVPALSLPIGAQTQVMPDRCNAALSDSDRKELLEINQLDREAYHVRRVCRQSGIDVGTEFEKAKAILGFSYSSRDQYCLNEAPKFKDYSFDYFRISAAVEAALQAWLGCYRLNRAGIIATPIIEPERLTLSLQRGSNTTAIVNWIKTTAGTKCFGKLGDGKLTELKTDLKLVLSSAETWTLVCDRIAVNSSNPVGAQSFPATIITVDTTSGPFQIKLKAEPHATERWASEISGRLDRVEATLTAMKSRIDDVRNSIPNAIVVTVGRQQGIMDVTNLAGQQRGTSAATNLAECGDNSVLSAVKLWHNVTATGHYYKCGTLSLVRR